MVKKKNDDTEYRALRQALDGGVPERLYIFHGEESYLLEYCLGRLREMADASGLGEFNHKRFNGASLSVDELIAAADVLPVFAERTLIEVNDFNIFKSGEATLNRLAEFFDDLPEYICLVFIYDTLEFAPDRRLKITKSLLKNAHVVEFTAPEEQVLQKWIIRHYKDAGKKISREDAGYLAFITGGLMTPLLGEIEKTSAYAVGDTVTRADIDAVVTPVLEAVAFKLADAVAAGDFSEAASQLSKLLQMREPPHKLVYHISLRLRQLYAARICIDAGRSASALAEMCDIRFGWQADKLIGTARSISTDTARRAVLHCADTAYLMNTGADYNEALTELMLSLASDRGKLE